MTEKVLRIVVPKRLTHGTERTSAKVIRRETATAFSKSAVMSAMAGVWYIHTAFS